jgi:hypothetical protein
VLRVQLVDQEVQELRLVLLEHLQHMLVVAVALVDLQIQLEQAVLLVVQQVLQAAVLLLLQVLLQVLQLQLQEELIQAVEAVEVAVQVL